MHLEGRPLLEALPRAVDDIDAHLAKIESEQMGVSSPPEHNAMVVNKLLSACLG